MLSNNGYVRGQYGVFGDKVYSGIKLTEYNLYDNEYTKHYLTTKEYVDSKFSKNTVFSVKSGYVHSMNGENNITQYTVGTSGTPPKPNADIDGKIITINENFVENDGYIIKSGDIYSIGFLNSVGTGTPKTGHINDIIKLELGQQLYSELDNQIYTLISAPIGEDESQNIISIPILVPETITLDNIHYTDEDTYQDNPITTTDIITFDKLFNDSVYHKITISPLDLSTNKIYSTTLTIPTTSTPSNYTAYIEYMLKNNNEESVGKIISLSSYSGIVKNGINALLFEISVIINGTPTTAYTAQISTIENNVEVIDIITIYYSSSEPSIINAKTTINSTSNNTYYLIDYYNKHVVKCVINNGTSGSASVSIDDNNIGTGSQYDVYTKDLSLLAELNITKVAAISPNTGYASYKIVIRALSSPDSQHITPWVIETPLILNTYKS